MSKSKIETPVRKVNPKLVMDGTLQKIKKNFPPNNGTTLIIEKFITEHPEYAEEFIMKFLDIVLGSISLENLKKSQKDPTKETSPDASKVE